MKPPLLIALSVAALAVGGYALATVWDARDESTPNGDTPKMKQRARDRPPTAERSSRSRPPSEDEQPRVGFEPAKLESDREPVEPLPPRPPPADVSLDEARAGFAEVMDDIDAAIEAGEPLSQREWTDLHRRGAQALDPMLRHLDPDDPQMGDEISRYQAQLRDKLRKLEPGQTTRIPEPE